MLREKRVIDAMARACASRGLVNLNPRVRVVHACAWVDKKGKHVEASSTQTRIRGECSATRTHGSQLCRWHKTNKNVRVQHACVWIVFFF